MLIIKNRNIKNSYLVIGFVLSIVLIIIGAILKIDKIESGDIFIICGLIIKAQIILMFIYKYGYLLRNFFSK